MKNKKKASQIHDILKERYPDVNTQLEYSNPFQLLVATILSAQCTDEQVNKVTDELFEKLKTPEDFAEVDREKLERLIHSTGFYRNKAKNIQKCSKALVEKHGGEVPDNLEDLVELPGVGRKTANLVLGCAFDIPGIVVDTHVSRVSQRTGLTENKNAEKIEYDLMDLLPKKEWNDFCLRLIFFGREICVARKPRCAKCPIYDLCDYPDKTA